MAESLLTEEEICTMLRVSREATLKFRRDLVDPIPHMKAGRRYFSVALRVVAAKTLGSIGPRARAAIPELNELRNDRIQIVRDAADEASKKIGDS